MSELGSEVAALIGRPLGTDERIAVAVSGGPDSLALLLLAQAAYETRLRALTVDHGFRPDSAAEAAMVASVCAKVGVAHETLAWTGKKPAANRQATARAARYRLMGDWCAANGVAWLLTAHHADDQAETLLMRLARGAGSGGLSGIRSRRGLGNGVTVLRPLLDWRRAELAEVAANAGLAPADDPSNRDLRYDRTRARALLAETEWLDPERLTAAASHLADAEAALDWTSDLAWRGRATDAADGVNLDAAGLPHELVRRLTNRALAALGCTEPRGPDVERLIARLTAGQTATLGGVAVTSGNVWRFRPVPPSVSR